MDDPSNGKRKMSDDLEPLLVRVEKTNPTTRNIHIDKNEFRIGRGRDNDMVLPYVSISRNHCIFRRMENAEWTIEDVSSSGTILNNIRLERGKPAIVSVGDSVQFSPSSEFVYTFILAVKSEPKAKKPRLTEQSELEDIRTKQRTFVELQQCERRKLAEKLEAQHEEQEKRKLELEKLLEDQRTASGEKECLNRQIEELKRNIEAGSVAEASLEKLNQALSERLEKERQEFEVKLNEEKQKMQVALEMSRQEKETLEAVMREQMERLRMEKEAEKKRIQESLTEEKKSEQAKLMDQNNVLVQKLKEMEEVLRAKDASTEELKNTLEKEKAAKSAEVIVVNSMTDSLAANCTAELEVLDTIDLTIDSPSVSRSNAAATRNVIKEDVFNTVGDIMDEQLTCSVCAELFVTAITLNCTHTFCQHCINTWVKKKKECPVCRSPITAMNRSLVLDNFIDKMVENLSVEHKNRRREIIDERRAEEAKEKEAEEQRKKQKQPKRGRGRGATSSTTNSRTTNPQTGATRSSRNARDREDREWIDRFHHRGREVRTSHPATSTSGEQPSTTGSTSHAQTSMPTDSTERARPQVNDSDDSSSSSSDSDNDESTDSSCSSSSSESHREGWGSPDYQSSQSNWESRGTEGTDVWSDYDDPMGFDDNSDDDFWGEDDYIEGIPGSYYGGFGSCYVCGNRGHWAPGCPFK